MNNFFNNNQEIIDKLKNYFKNLPKENYYDTIFPTVENLEDFEALVNWTENRILEVQKIPDSKKRFDLSVSFFKKLHKEKLYNPQIHKLHKDDYVNAKKISSTIELNNFKKYKNSPDMELAVKYMCDMYVFSYERICRWYFKPLVKIITKKEYSCGSSIKEIIDFDQGMKFVLEPFSNHIRNSIDHLGYHIAHDKIIVFEDKEKPPIHLTMDTLRTMCEYQIVTDVCFSTAEAYLKFPKTQKALEIYKKTVNYCTKLNLNFNDLINKFLKEGYTMLQINWVLKQIINEK